MNWYLEVLKKYAVFSGRAQRKEYWIFFLFNIIISFALSFIQERVGVPVRYIYMLAVLLPGIALTVRRLHDTNRSGWRTLLISLIPIVGVIFLIRFMVQDSDPGENQYGPNPKTGL